MTMTNFIFATYFFLCIVLKEFIFIYHCLQFAYELFTHVTSMNAPSFVWKVGQCKETSHQFIIISKKSLAKKSGPCRFPIISSVLQYLNSKDCLFINYFSTCFLVVLPYYHKFTAWNVEINRKSLLQENPREKTN